MDQNRIELMIDLALAEDLGDQGDITARACIPAQRRGLARIEARQAGVVCGMDICIRVFEKVANSKEITLHIHFKDGERVQAMDTLMDIEGPLETILSAERTALNFLQRLSGIATATAEYCDLLSDTKTRVLDTRKTVPCWRDLDKYAVHCGGGKNHRRGLFDLFLIKENHILGAGSVREAVERAHRLKNQEGHSCAVEIEVENLDELEQAISAGADIVMLDNFTPQMVDSAVALAAGRVELEVSGGITRETLRDYARRGVDYISVGALTHSVRAFDCSLLVEEVRNA